MNKQRLVILTWNQLLYLKINPEKGEKGGKLGIREKGKLFTSDSLFVHNNFRLIRIIGIPKPEPSKGRIYIVF